MAGKSNTPPKPGAKHKQLGVFIGVWHTEGTVLADGAKLVGTDTYEWMPGGFFQLHRVEAEIGGSEVNAFEVVGVDGKDIWTQSFDNTGNVQDYRARLTGRKWEIDGRLERFRGTFSADRRSLTGRWENRSTPRARWAAWMDIKLTKSR